MADPILPLGIFNAVAGAYMPSQTTDPSRDPLISPLLCARQAPQVRLISIPPFSLSSFKSASFYGFSSHAYPNPPPSLPSLLPSVAFPPLSSVWGFLTLS